MVFIPFQREITRFDQLIIINGFSRLPVYKGTLDHPQGLVLLKDLALQHGFGLV